MSFSLPALIFDLDGTLTDSKPGILGCLRKVIAQHRLQARGPLDRFVGPPVEEWCVELLPEGTEEERVALAQEYRCCYDREGWQNNAVYPGVREALEELRSAGYPLYVCTSKQQHFAVRILMHFGLASLFEAIYGDRAEFEDHAKPLLLGHLLREQGIEPANAWMVGDRIHDIEAARANGVRSIAAGWGYGPDAECAQATAIAATPAGLVEMIRA